MGDAEVARFGALNRGMTSVLLPDHPRAPAPLRRIHEREFPTRQAEEADDATRHTGHLRWLPRNYASGLIEAMQCRGNPSSPHQVLVSVLVSVHVVSGSIVSIPYAADLRRWPAMNPRGTPSAAS